MSNLSRYEQETVIGYNQEESTAHIYTHHPALKKKLNHLLELRGNDMEKLDDNNFIVPKRWVKVNATKQLSEAQLEKARENARANLVRKKSASTNTPAIDPALIRDIFGDEDEDDPDNDIVMEQNLSMPGIYAELAEEFS